MRFAQSARVDLERLTAFLVEQSPAWAAEAETAIRDAVSVLRRLPLVGRPARQQGDPTLRELLVPFGTTGYVVLYRVGPGALVSILAARHQREEHYH